MEYCAACNLMTPPTPALQGLIGVTLSSGVHQLQGPDSPISNQAFFIGSLYVIAIGTGGTVSCAGMLLPTSGGW